MLRNRRGATSLRWLRALLDHGIEVHGQVVVLPRRQRRRRARRHARRRARPVPRAGHAVRRAARAVAGTTASRPCGPTPVDEAAAVVDAVEDWQDVFRVRARPAAGLRRRRVLPAGRPAVPARRRLRGLPDARGRHRHGPHLRARVHRPGRASRPASQSGFFAWVDGAPAEGYRAPATRRRGRGCGSPRRPMARRLVELPGGAAAVTAGPGRRAHRPLRRPGAAPAPRRRSGATTCGWSRSPTSSSAATPA